MKLEIMQESFNYKGPHLQEDYILSNFVKGFNEDLKYFGEDAVIIYKAFFGIDKEIDFLYENRGMINEVINNTKRPFLFEKVIDKVFGRQCLTERNDGMPEKIAKVSWANSGKNYGGGRTLSADEINAAYDKAGFAKREHNFFGGKKVEAMPDGETFTPFKTPTSKISIEDPTGNGTSAFLTKLKSEPAYATTIKLPTEQKAALADQLSAVANAPNREVAMEQLAKIDGNQLQGIAGFGSRGTSGVNSAAEVASKASEAGTSAATGAATGAADAAGGTGFLGNLLTGIKGIFGKIKNFFTGGVSSVGDAVSKGNWGALLHIPLVQVAGAVGGVLLIKKILNALSKKKGKK